MSLTLSRFISLFPSPSTKVLTVIFRPTRRCRALTARFASPQSHSQVNATSEEEVLAVVGGGAAGVFGAIRAKTVAPNLKVLVVEKGKPLSKVSGGDRFNVTNGHCSDNLIFAEHYPRGHREFRGSFFREHGPMDTMAWFHERGVNFKTEDDGRVFPVTDSSSSVIDCLMSEAKDTGDNNS